MKGRHPLLLLSVVAGADVESIRALGLSEIEHLFPMPEAFAEDSVELVQDERHVGVHHYERRKARRDRLETLVMEAEQTAENAEGPPSPSSGLPLEMSAFAGLVCVSLLVLETASHIPIAAAALNYDLWDLRHPAAISSTLAVAVGITAWTVICAALFEIKKSGVAERAALALTCIVIGIARTVTLTGGFHVPSTIAVILATAGIALLIAILIGHTGPLVITEAKDYQHRRQAAKQAQRERAQVVQLKAELDSVNVQVLSISRVWHSRYGARGSQLHRRQTARSREFEVRKLEADIEAAVSARQIIAESISAVCNVPNRIIGALTQVIRSPFVALQIAGEALGEALAAIKLAFAPLWRTS